MLLSRQRAAGCAGGARHASVHASRHRLHIVAAAGRRGRRTISAPDDDDLGTSEDKAVSLILSPKALSRLAAIAVQLSAITCLGAVMSCMHAAVGLTLSQLMYRQGSGRWTATSARSMPSMVLEQSCR